MAALFAGLFQLTRPLYVTVYVATVGAFLYAYTRWSHADLKGEFVDRWIWGLVGDTWPASPRSPTPEGFALLVNLFWLGVVYGLVDGLLLSVLPVYATWQAAMLLAWTEGWPSRTASGALALLASALVIAFYHLDYPSCPKRSVISATIS